MFVLYGHNRIVVRGNLCNPAKERRRREDWSRISRSAKKIQKNRLYARCLFSLDAFGGGFVVQSMLALWLFQKFQLSIAMAGTIFFWAGIFSALSYLAAVRIADRFGLVNTMVFTHLPANLLLILIPIHAYVGLGDRFAARKEPPFANGCADAKFICHGDRAPGGTRRRSEHYTSSAQPGIRRRVRFWPDIC